MPYDIRLDESVFSKYWESDNMRISVSVNSYKKGMRKLQIVRENKNSSGALRFVKLGRMTKEEVKGVLPIINDALALMD